MRLIDARQQRKTAVNGVGGFIVTVAQWSLSICAGNLRTGRRSAISLTGLLVLVLAYSIASTLLHHIWFFMRGERQGIFN